MEHSEFCLHELKQLLVALRDHERRYQTADPAASLELYSRQLRLNPNSSGGRSSSQCDMHPAITLKSLPGRGIGAVATQVIPAGSIILKEEAVLTVQDGFEGPITPESFVRLVGGYSTLPPAIRQRILGLHAYTPPGQKSLVRHVLNARNSDLNFTESLVEFVCRLSSIFATNSFEPSNRSYSSLYLEASRFNHSCLPNCEYAHGAVDNPNGITIYASRDIQPGEEITVAYLNTYEPRDRRQAETLHNWGFVCNCPACDKTNPALDTAVHEGRLARYRRLRRESYLTTFVDLSAASLPLEDLNKVFQWSIKRAQITKAIRDNHGTLEEYVLPKIALFLPIRFHTNLASMSFYRYLFSAEICERKWLLTGKDRHMKSQIRFLDLGTHLAEYVPLSRRGQGMKEKSKNKLRAAMLVQRNSRRAK